MHIYKEKKKLVGENKFPSILFLFLKITFYLNYSGSQIKLHEAAGHGFTQTLYFLLLQKQVPILLVQVYYKKKVWSIYKCKGNCPQCYIGLKQHRVMLRKFSFKKHIEIEFHLNSSTQLFTLLQQLNREAKFSMKIHAKQKLFTHCCSFALFSYTVIRYSAQFVTIELYVCVLLLFLWLYDYVFYV